MRLLLVGVNPGLSAVEVQAHQWAVPRGRRSRADSRRASRAARLAGRLRELRIDAGITQERLASQAGVAIATVRKIETRAVVEPGNLTIMALMEALGARPDDLRADSGC
jgi:DNA-binding XRE family transcriptional regulator